MFYSLQQRLKCTRQLHQIPGDALLVNLASWPHALRVAAFLFAAARGKGGLSTILTGEKAPTVLISITQLSALWNVPKATLYNWVSQGRLPYVKLGRLLRFDVSAIEDLRRRSSVNGGQEK